MPLETSTQNRSPNQIPSLLRQKVFAAQCLLFWEEFWPTLWPLIAVVALFMITAFFGFWSLLPVWSKMIGLAGFGTAFLVALARILRLSLPSRDAALRHLERRSGIPHRPASAYGDPVALGATDPAAAILWAAHRKRLAASLKKLRPGWPRSRFLRSDPYALRVPLVLALVIGAALAGPGWLDRLLTPFQLNTTDLTPPVRIDAWISPPVYTGRAPIFLTGQAAARPAKPGEVFLVPVGSEFVLRAQGERRISVGMRPLNGAVQDPMSPGADFAVTAPGENIREYRAPMVATRHITVLDNNQVVARWQIEVLSDEPPKIRFAAPPERSISGSLKLSYTLKDDFGIVAAEALIERRHDEASTGEGSTVGVASAAERPLVAAPRFALSLPQMRTRAGIGQTYQDLTAHPWAGTRVTLTLRVEDDLGQSGTSDPVELVLPSRAFTNPLARALVEQRRILALSPDRRALVGLALDALTIAPQEHIENLNIYLSLRTARWRLKLAQDRETLVSVVDQLWQIALHIEDGNLSDAEQELRAVQEALQRALAEHAPPEEIRDLMQKLRGALDRYMQALAENAPSGVEQQGENDQQSISQDDLNRMLDNIENMTRNGAQDQAQQLLSQLQDILENLRAGQAQARNPEQQMMSQSLEQLGELMDRQRQLMDDTFRYDQQRSDGKQAPVEEGANADMDRLRQEQAELQAMLDQLMEQMQEFNGQGNDNFDDAKGNMGEALNSLGQGETGPAASEQGKALENLRAGAKTLAEQLAESQAQAGGRQGRRNVDPMGRARASQDPDLGQNVKVPDEIDIQQAREILQELRRRLGETTRPRLELDYFERLLRRF